MHVDLLFVPLIEPKCDDGVKNGLETDTDCGGTTCVLQGKTCARWSLCKVYTDCASGECVDGLCRRKLSIKFHKFLVYASLTELPYVFICNCIAGDSSTKIL